MKSVREYLESHPFFAGLDSAQMDRIAGLTSEVSFDIDRLLFKGRIAVVFMIMIHYASFLPWIFRAPSVSNKMMISTLFMGFDGGKKVNKDAIRNPEAMEWFAKNGIIIKRATKTN